MARRSALVVTLALAAATCSAQAPSFYNPSNGAVSECTGTRFDPYGDKCVATYERAGWVRVSGPVISRTRPPSTSP